MLSFSVVTSAVCEYYFIAGILLGVSAVSNLLSPFMQFLSCIVDGLGRWANLHDRILSLQRYHN